MIKKKSNLPLFLLLLLMAIILGGGWYYYDSQKRPQAIPPELTPKIDQAVEESSPVEKTASAPGEQQTPPVPPQQKPAPLSDCERIAGKIEKFFTTLDNLDYMAERKLSGGSQAYLSRLIDKLIANPPTVSQEKESLFAILNNTAHFYRVLKGEDIFLVKEILDNEGDSLEENMALFYRWSELAADCPDAGILVHLPLPGLYEYAGFFLNTLGGQSYLFRRDSRTRMLIKFYSVKVMDRAEDASLNRYGLDFRPSIDSLLEELKSAQNLDRKEEYLAELILLQDKYEQKFGGQAAQSTER
jgi:hypothetical protein